MNKFNLFLLTSISFLLFSCKDKVVVDYSSAQLFTLSNQTTENKLLIFKRNLDGTLAYDSSITLFGKGIGSLLGSANPLTRSEDGNWLFAVNAGSNNFSIIDIRGNIPIVTDTISSNGIKPVSIAVHQNWVFVLNQGGIGTVSGFSFDANGSLTPLPNANISLGSNAVNPAQISFTANGNALIVTEKDSSKIDLISLNSNGSINQLSKFDAANPKPYGFVVNTSDYIFVSEAVNNNMSVYHINNNTLEWISTSASNQQGACWMGMSPAQNFVYMVHAGSNALTGFNTSNPNQPQLLNSNGLTATTGSHPVEITVSNNPQQVFVLNSGSNSISSFGLVDDGSLNFIAETAGLPVGAIGLALR